MNDKDLQRCIKLNDSRKKPNTITGHNYYAEFLQMMINNDFYTDGYILYKLIDGKFIYVPDRSIIDYIPEAERTSASGHVFPNSSIAFHASYFKRNLVNVGRQY